MDNKLNMIMLVDDDYNTNFYNKIIIGRLNICENIEIFQNGKSALDFLTTTNKNNNFPQPKIIFLDINMPIMTGWEFIEQYNKLQKKQQGEILITMLTSSINKEDEEKALKNNVISEFISKPLIEEGIKDIMNKYFAN